MLERTLEILVRKFPNDLLDQDWTLIAQQLQLQSGRLDLLFKDVAGARHLVELKKGPASKRAVDQVLEYATELSGIVDSSPVVPWVVAHEVPDSVSKYATAHDVRCREVAIKDCQAVIVKYHVLESELFGVRKQPGVLSGGEGKRGLRGHIPNEEAYREMAKPMVEYLETLERRVGYEITSGGMQTVVHYKRVKLGGINRKHRDGVAYIATGVVLGVDDEDALANWKFRPMEKRQSGSRETHVWWEVPSIEVASFAQAIERFSLVVDRAIG